MVTREPDNAIRRGGSSGSDMLWTADSPNNLSKGGSFPLAWTALMGNRVG